MSHIIGTDRSQLQMIPLSLEDMVDQDNPVRIIDLFVKCFDFKKLGFRNSVAPAEGRPPFAPADLMKLYLYGYLNRIRSSRKLERECCRNIELIWLMRGLQPAYHTIADFRSRHPKEIKNFFRQFVTMLQGWDLVDGKLIAIDGSKFRAQNSSKNNFNEKKIADNLTYIDQKIAAYITQLDEQDQTEHGDRKLNVKEIKARIHEQKARREKYEALRKELKKTGESQISTTDPDARNLPINHGRIEVSYNAQSAVDAKHNLVVHYDNTNKSDRNALSETAIQTKENLNKDKIEVLADKGYHNGEQLHTCQENNIVTYVSVPDVPRPKTKQVPTPDYYGEKFIYNKATDSFTCPQGQKLRTNGNWYPKHYDTPVKHYKTPACKTCPAKGMCTTNANGRLMERSMYAEATERNKARTEKEKEKYLLRQQIVEHPFGIIKRQWGYDHVLMKGKEKNQAEFGLIYTAFNLRRIMSLLSVKQLKRRLKKALSNFLNLSFPIVNSNIRNFYPASGALSSIQ